MEGEQGGFLLHIPALYFFALLLNRLHIVKNLTWFQFVSQSQEWSGKYVENIFFSIPGMMWHFGGHQRECLSQILQICTEVVIYAAYALKG